MLLLIRVILRMAGHWECVWGGCIFFSFLYHLFCFCISISKGFLPMKCGEIIKFVIAASGQKSVDGSTAVIFN